MYDYTLFAYIIIIIRYTSSAADCSCNIYTGEYHGNCVYKDYLERSKRLITK